MFTYNKDLNLLVYHKVRNVDMGDRFDCLKDVKESFQKFINSTALETVELINEILHDRTDVSDSFIFTTGTERGYRQDIEHKVIYGYVKGRQPVKVFVMPYMDSLGKLHFYRRGDSTKILVNKLVSSDDISYDVARKCLSLVLNKRTIRITSKKKSIQVEGVNGNNVDLAVLVDMLQYKEGKNVNIKPLLLNPLLQNSLVNVDGRPNKFAVSTIDKDTKLISGFLENDDYGASKIRNSLNSTVSLSRALGEVLSRPVLEFPAGTYVTQAVIDRVAENYINTIYIKYIIPAPKLKITGGIGPGFEGAMITSIDAGTIVTPYLRPYLYEYYPDFADCDMLPEKIQVSGSYFSFNGKYASQEILDFLYSVGFHGVRVGSKGLPYYFELEVIGNNTYLEDGKWVHYADGVVDRHYIGDRITSEDLLALLSTIGFMNATGKNVFMDKDRDFLKNVEMANEAMSKALAKAIRSHMRMFTSHIVSYIRGGAQDTMYIFSKLTEEFRSNLQEAGVIDTCDTTNFLAEISQATHLNKKVLEAPESMRQIAVPYYGRICPFETPEGKQLGLVNNKALGCAVVDGELMASVRRVLKSGNKVRIADKIELLSVRDSMSVRISDIMELTPSNVEGEYLDTRITAIVPNPEPTGEKLVYAKVMTSDLDYVFAHTDAFISATVSTIPFACSDDAVRVSFGSKMMKAAIYLLDPDEPCVQTSMYREIFRSSDAYLLRATGNGVVDSIEQESVSIMYDGDSDLTVHVVDEFKVTKDSVVLMRYRVKVGDRVTKGQVLADTSFSNNGVYCPGKNELVAYMSTGYNYEDAVHVSERASIDFISMSSAEIKRNRDSAEIPDRSGMCKYFKRGEQLTSIPRRNSHGDVQQIPVTAEHSSGIWYNFDANAYSNNKRVFKFSLLGFNKLQTGDKMSGRHGNKGVDAKVSDNSEMPMLANGMSVRILLNPHGVPSRMNTGQIYEGHLGLAATVLGINVGSDAYNGATPNEVKALMRMAHELANCGNASMCRSICSKYGMPDDLITVIESHMPNILEWANTFDENGDAWLFNPVTGKWFPYKITIGVSTMLKLKQEIETKIHVRAGSLEGSYRMTTSQPPKGGEGGGQAMGEMELAAIMAYGASDMLYEMCGVKSDNETERCNSELEAAGSLLRVPEKYSTQRAVTNAMYFLEAFGIALDGDEGELPAVDWETSRSRYVYRVRDVIQEDSNEVSEENVDKVLSLLD